jgi:AbrB family looped-hinge helix DNA binding protein
MVRKTMPTATVTTKGQITIPKDVREHLGVETGDRISFVVRPDGTVLVTPLTRHVRELGGLLHRSNRRAVSVEEMEERVSTRMGAKFRRRR